MRHIPHPERPRIALPAVSLVLACALLTVATAAGAAEEELAFILPEGWHEVYAGREQNLSTSEYVPGSQTEHEWDEMLTVQILIGEREADPKEMIFRAAAQISGQCEAFDAQPIELKAADDYPTHAALTACGRERGEAHGEVSLLRAIAGDENFYLLRKAWRTAPFAAGDDPPVDLEQRRFWLGFLSYLRVCRRGNCPKHAE